MSETDKPKVEEEESRTYDLVKTKSYDKVPRKSESQSIVINFYSGSCSPRTDKFIQTERILSTTFLDSSDHELTLDRKEVATATQSEQNLVDRLNERYPPLLPRKSGRSMSDDKKEEKPMESRRQISDGKSVRSSSAARTTSDLERRRLEAELKAAEEIAQLKQNLIEKRLALELATIEDGVDVPQKMVFAQHSSHQPEFRALEELAMRKQSLIETNLAQERESLDYQNRMQPPRPPPPPPPRQSTPTQMKPSTFKTDSSSSMMNSLRGLNMLEKKLNLDRRFSGDSGQRNPNTFNFMPHTDLRYTDPRLRRDDRYPNYPPRPDDEYRAPRLADPGRAQSAWKSAMAKIKKKIKSKPSRHNWSDD